MRSRSEPERGYYAQTYFLSFFFFFYNVALQACLTTELLSQWVVPQDVGLLKFCGESPYTLRLGNYMAIG